MTKPTWFTGAPFVAIPVALLRDARLKPRDLAVFAAIASHADPAGRASPSLARLAEILGYSENSISELSRCTSRLEQFGWLKKDSYKNKKRRLLDSVCYTLQLSDTADTAQRQLTERKMTDEAYEAKRAATMREKRLPDYHGAPDENALVKVRTAGDSGKFETMTYLELAAMYQDYRETGDPYISPAEWAEHLPVLQLLKLA